MSALEPVDMGNGPSETPDPVFGACITQMKQHGICGGRWGRRLVRVEHPNKVMTELDYQNQRENFHKGVVDQDVNASLTLIHAEATDKAIGMDEIILALYTKVVWAKTGKPQSQCLLVCQICYDLVVPSL